MQNNKAFTLIEVMVVIAIIALLITMSVPGYSEYQKRQSLFDAKRSLVTYANFLDHALVNNTALPEKLPEIQGVVINNNKIYTNNKQYEIQYLKATNHYQLSALWQHNSEINCYRLELYSSGYRNAFTANNQESISCWQ